MRDRFKRYRRWQDLLLDGGVLLGFAATASWLMR